MSLWQQESHVNLGRPFGIGTVVILGAIQYFAKQLYRLFAKLHHPPHLATQRPCPLVSLEIVCLGCIGRTDISALLEMHGNKRLQGKRTDIPPVRAARAIGEIPQLVGKCTPL